MATKLVRTAPATTTKDTKAAGTKRKADGTGEKKGKGTRPKPEGPRLDPLTRVEKYYNDAVVAYEKPHLKEDDPKKYVVIPIPQIRTIVDRAKKEIQKKLIQSGRDEELAEAYLKQEQKLREKNSTNTPAIIRCEHGALIVAHAAAQESLRDLYKIGRITQVEDAPTEEERANRKPAKTKKATTKVFQARHHRMCERIFSTMRGSDPSTEMALSYGDDVHHLETGAPVEYNDDQLVDASEEAQEEVVEDQE
jgi:hypothetical protein